MDEQFIQIRFSVETPSGVYNDALYFTPEQFATMTPEDVEAAKQAKFQAFQDALSNETFESRQRKKFGELGNWYAQQTQFGITIGGITLAARKDDQDRYTSLATAEHLALTLGQRQLTDTTGLADSVGTWHSMTLQQLFTTLLQYSSALFALSQQFAGWKQQILAATTKEELDAITIG